MGSQIAFTVGLAALIVALFWLILKKSSGSISTQYKLLAKRFEIQFEQPAPKMAGFMRPEPSLYGIYRGREMSISVPGKGLQGTRQIETVLKMGMKETDIRAQLTASGPLGSLRQRDSGKQQRWNSGDEAFDNAIDVRTNHGDQVGALLNADRRAWLASNLKKSKATLYIGGSTLAYAKLGLIGNESTREDFEAAAEFLHALAEAIEQI